MAPPNFIESGVCCLRSGPGMIAVLKLEVGHHAAKNAASLRVCLPTKRIDCLPLISIRVFF